MAIIQILKLSNTNYNIRISLLPDFQLWEVDILVKNIRYNALHYDKLHYQKQFTQLLNYQIAL